MFGRLTRRFFHSKQVQNYIKEVFKKLDWHFDQVSVAPFRWPSSLYKYSYLRSIPL